MTYKLNPEIRKIKSKVNLLFPDGMTKTFLNGDITANAVFDTPYIISEISAIGCEINLVLTEQTQLKQNNEMVSFF